MTVVYVCECNFFSTDAHQAFIHRLDCQKVCKPLAEHELPMQRITGIEKEQICGLSDDSR